VQEPERVAVVIQEPEPEPVPEAEPEAIPAAAAFLMPYPDASRPDFVIGQFAPEEPLVERERQRFLFQIAGMDCKSRRRFTPGSGNRTAARDHHPAAPTDPCCPRAFREAHFTMDILIAAKLSEGFAQRSNVNDRAG